MSSDNKLWLPPLSPQKQKLVNKQRLGQHVLGNFIKGLVKWVGLSDKTLLDLLSIIAIPVVIAVATMQFSAQQSDASSQASERQHKTDLQIAQDQQQEVALQTYLDRMSDLLLNSKLHEPQSDDEVRSVARARTLTVLPQLNGIRKGEVVQFLYEASLIGTTDETPIIDLSGANLSHANLSYAHLMGVHLNGVNLIGADLDNAYLIGAYLDCGAYWGSVPLSCTNLSYANLSGAELWSAKLSNANLMGANLMGAKLEDVDLNGVYLLDANLSGANLVDAVHVTTKQLAEAKSLKDVIMPDGTKHI